MSLKYSLSLRRNPLRPEDEPMYYGTSQGREIVDEDKLARRIAYSTSLTEGDVRNVLRSLTFEMKSCLADGDIVSLGTLGTFRFTIKTDGAVTRDEFTHHNIKKVRFQFTPGSLAREAMGDLKFEEVIPLKVLAEVKRELKKT